MLKTKHKRLVNEKVNDEKYALLDWWDYSKQLEAIQVIDNKHSFI